MLHRILALTMTLAALAIVGCEASPSVHVTDVRVVDQTEQGGRVVLEVDLINPNDFVLPMPTADYTVSVEGAGQFSFQGVVPLAVMPAQGTQTLQLPAAFTVDQPLTGKPFAAHGSIQYDPPGEWRAFLTQSGFPLPEVDFQETGTID